MGEKAQVTSLSEGIVDGMEDNCPNCGSSVDETGKTTEEGCIGSAQCFACGLVFCDGDCGY